MSTDFRDCPTPGKVKFLDREGAMLGALRVLARMPGSTMQSWYHCCRPPRRAHGCGFWHLTSGRLTARCGCPESDRTFFPNLLDTQDPSG